MTASVRPAASEFGTVDPAPASADKDVKRLRAVLLGGTASLFEKYKAIFALRNLNTDETAVVLGEALVADASALLRHECAYVLGQMQKGASFPFLVKALRNDESPMVRHESAEALGALGGERVLPELKRALVADGAVEVRESCELALRHFEYLEDRTRLEL